jgi:hypothetical protein
MIFTAIVAAWLMVCIVTLAVRWARSAPATPDFQYQYEHVPGTGPRWRWVCQTCGRGGTWMLSRERAMRDTKRSHGWDACPT